MTSTDGITWTSHPAANFSMWTSVTYGNGMFVAVSNNGNGDRVMTSPDGVTWTSQASAADNDWMSVVFAGGMFVAVAASGTGDRVMTSGAMTSMPLLDASQWTVVHQGLPLPASGECADVDDAAVAYGTGLTGGWTRGWAGWAGPRVDGVPAGGWTCERTLVNTGGTRWVLGRL